MSETFCTYQGTRDEQIVAYLYGDLDADGRRAFDAHLLECPVCRAEVEELGAVRQQLARWSPPEPARIKPFAAPAPAAARSAWDLLGNIPAWAQVAAALLVLGISAAIANVEVRYDASGFTVRTGWQTIAPANGAAAERAATTASSPASTPSTAQTAAADAAPWRAELAALSEQLRASSSSPATSDAELMRRVRALIAASEQRQQNELALRVAELTLAMDQRRAVDLARVQRALDEVGTSAGKAAMFNRTQINNLALKVGQRQ